VDKRRDIQQAAQELEELFADLWQVFPFPRGIRRGYRPTVDVFRTDNPPTVTALVDLPGVDPERVKLVAMQRALVVTGERRRPADCGHYEQMEIEYGPFQREVTLSEDIDPERATATYERGILRVTLPVVETPAARENIPIRVRTEP
jgi:HSP20 family protein